jgi:hypothetical protein
MGPKRARHVIQDEDSGDESDVNVANYLVRPSASGKPSSVLVAARKQSIIHPNAGSAEESDSDEGVEEGKGGEESDKVNVQIPKRNAAIC